MKSAPKLKSPVLSYLVAHHRREQALFFLMVLAVLGLSLGMIHLGRLVVDLAILGRDPGRLVALLAAFSAAGFAYLGFSYFRSVLGRRIQLLFVADLRDRLIARLMSMPPNDLSRASVGELQNRIMHDVARFGAGVEYIIATPFVGVLTCLAYGAFLVSISFEIFATACLPVIAVAILSRALNERLAAKRALVTQTQSGFASSNLEVLRGIGEIQLHGAYDQERRRLRSSHQKMEGAIVDEGRGLALIETLAESGQVLGPLIVYSLGGVLAIQGRLTVGEIVAALAALSGFYSGVSSLTTYGPVYRNVSDRYGELRRLLQWPLLKGELGFTEPAHAEAPDAPVYEVRDLVYRTDEGRPLLNVPSLTIGSAEHLALVGRSGCGKTTLLNILSGRLLPSSGSVSLGGTDTRRMSNRDRVRSIGYVSQVSQLRRGTLRDNLLYRSKVLMETFGAPLPSDDELLRICHSLAFESDLVDMALQDTGDQPQWVHELKAEIAGLAQQMNLEQVSRELVILGVPVAENLLFSPLEGDDLDRVSEDSRWSDLLRDHAPGLSRWIGESADSAVAREQLFATGLRSSTPADRDIHDEILRLRDKLAAEQTFPEHQPFDCAGWHPKWPLVEQLASVRMSQSEGAAAAALKKATVDWLRREERLDEVLRLALDHEVHEDGANLSGGQRQKVALARVLVTRPPIILLDEATASLDPASAETVRQFVQQAYRDRTVVWVSHDMAISRFVDRVLQLEGGVIAA